MDQNSLLEGRIRDLSEKAYNSNYLTHTCFLAASELAQFHAILRKQGISSKVHAVNGAPYLIFGGRADADRNVVVFLPDYMTEESFLAEEPAQGDVIRCLHVTPLNRKFTDALTHRDYLGALMNMGIERDQIGDILCGDAEAFIFVLTDMADIIAREFTRVKHTSVRCEVVPPSACTLEPAWEELSCSVASERLDAVLAMVYRLSRTKAQELITAENVFIDGRTVTDTSYTLKPDERISVRGHGKFIFTGTGNTTKKGRVYAHVKLYK